MTRISGSMYPGDYIQCKYNSQLVKGIVTRIEQKYIVVSLSTNYSGKNEYWGIGELKVLYKKIMRNIVATAPAQAIPHPIRLRSAIQSKKMNHDNDT